MISIAMRSRIKLDRASASDVLPDAVGPAMTSSGITRALPELFFTLRCIVCRRVKPVRVRHLLNPVAGRDRPDAAGRRWIGRDHPSRLPAQDGEFQDLRFTFHGMLPVPLFLVTCVPTVGTIHLYAALSSLLCSQQTFCGGKVSSAHGVGLPIGEEDDVFLRGLFVTLVGIEWSQHAHVPFHHVADAFVQGRYRTLIGQYEMPLTGTWKFSGFR